MEKKERKKRLHSFIFRLRVSLCFRTNANAEIRATQTEREREREGRVANTSSSFCGLVRETRAFCLRKGNSKERERSSF